MPTRECKGCGQQLSESAPECICGVENPHHASPPPSSPLPEPEPEPEPEPAEPEATPSPPMSPHQEEEEEVKK